MKELKKRLVRKFKPDLMQELLKESSVKLYTNREDNLFSECALIAASLMDKPTEVVMKTNDEWKADKNM